MACCESCASCTTPVNGWHSIRISSIVLSLISLLALLVILPTYFFYTNVHPGNIGCMILLMVASFSGCFSKLRFLAGLCLFLTLAGFIWNAISAIGDPLVITQIYMSPSACINRNGTNYYGPKADNGVYKFNLKDACPYQTHDCTCIFEYDTSQCYVFEGRSDCNDFYDKFIPMYSATAAFEVITCFLAGVTIIILLFALCCSKLCWEEKEGYSAV
mmetsp:Transcript_26418/g.26668  ORF Transcript_26418/g.26668 Transcript_26418/m.26668 type:complete len:216 (-) Transcript_26418:25-672(-)